MNDEYGVEVSVGDTIVYAVRRRTRVRVHRAIVVDIETRPSPWGNGRYETRLKIEVEATKYSNSRKATLTSPTFVIIKKVVPSTFIKEDGGTVTTNESPSS